MATSPTGSDRAAQLFQLQVQAEGEGNYELADAYKQQQLEQTVLNQGLLQANGLPGETPTETSQVVDPEVEIYRQFYSYMEKQGQLDAMLEQHDFQGIGTEFDQMVMQPYKDRNGEALLQDKPGMTDEERIEMMRQLEPVVVDPNWIANLRQRLVKLDIDMKRVDPSFSVYKNPKTARVANWVAREVGPMTEGFVQSGEQEMEGLTYGLGETMGFAEGVTGFGMNILAGLVDGSAKAIKAIVGEEYGLPWAVATNYVEDADGNLVNNGGKVPGIVQTIAAVNARMLDQNVLDYVSRVDKAREFEAMNANGFEKISRGASAVIGMGLGFGLPAGAAMKGGQVAFAPLMTKGLQRLAVGGASPRMVKLARTLSGIPGAAVGNGIAEGLAFGRAEGYGTAFVHGMAMAPVLMALGALGRRSESVLARKKAPQWLARSVSGGLEGVGFGTLEAAQTGALWKLMQDPSNETWEIYAKNMLGFAIFKGAFGRSVVDAPEFGATAEAAGRQAVRQQAREKLAEEVSRAEEVKTTKAADELVKQKAAEETADLETREQEIAERAKAAGDQVGKPPTAEEAAREMKELWLKDEAQDAKELSTEQLRERAAQETDADLKQVFETELGSRGQQRLSAQELAQEVQRLRAAGPTPENRKRVIELLEQERGRLTEAAAGEIQRQVEVGVKAGELAPGRRFPSKPRMAPTEVGAELEARVEASGIPREILQELGDISRARRAARSPAEASTLWKRQLELERELDALEMAQDPVMNATMRELIREREVEELQAAEELRAVDPTFGERPGPESMRSDANPYRQQENLLVEGETPVAVSEILNVLKGRAGFKGVRIGGRRLGKIEGSPVQVAIREGRIAGKGTAGVFKIFENLTRTKEGMDLVVALHEWAHAMQRQVQVGQGGPAFSKEVRKWMKNLPDDALADMAMILRNYPGSQALPLWVTAAEAWAEWHARNMLGDATLRGEVPALSRELDAWLKTQSPAFMAQYQDVMKLVDIYKRQGSLERLNKSIRRGEQRKQGTVAEQIIRTGEGVWDKVVKSFFDDMHLLKKSQSKWIELSDVDVTQLSILENPARLYDAVAMTAGKQAQSLLTRGMHNIGFERTGEALKTVFDDLTAGLKGKAKNDRTIDFVNYLVANRALDLINKGKKQTLPKSDYVEALRQLNEMNPDFAKFLPRVKAWTDGLLDLVGEAGGIPAADVQRMKDYSVVYLPFHRALEGTVTQRGSRGVAEKGNAVKTMKGDTREISDPMQAMFETTTTMLAKAQQQMVMKSLYKLMLRADVGGLATRVDRSNVPQKYQLDQVFRQMEKGVRKRLAEEGLEGEDLELWDETFGMLGELIKDGNVGDELITMFGQKLMPFGEGGNLVAYTPRLTSAEIEALPKHSQARARMWNKKMQWLELDEHAYTALMGLDKPLGPTFMDNALMKVLFGYPKKAVRFFATDANPAFVAANAIRDIASVPVFSADGEPGIGRYIPLWRGFKKFWEGGSLMFAKEHKEVADMFEASGARTASIYNEGIQREMRGEVIGKIGQVKEAVLKATGQWTEWMSKPESFLRISEFKAAREKALAEGKSNAEAALEGLEAAKEITVNFARAGAIARAYNQMTPYFSASFAGQRKLFRSISGMEGRTDAERARLQAAAISNAFINITAPAFAIWALTHDQDWYRDLPEWRKRHFVNFKIPGTDTIASLPLPFEMGTLFASLPIGVMDRMTDSNPIELMPAMGESVFPYLRGLSSLLPAGLKPIAESTAGYDYFSGRDLTPYWLKQHKEPGEQVVASTTEMARWAFNNVPIPTSMLGIDNPIELQHFLGAYSAGAFPALFKMGDELFNLKDHPGMSTGIAAPFQSFINRFAKQTPHGASRTVTEFYQVLKPELERRARADNRTPADRRARREVNRLADEMADIRKQVQRGEIGRVEGDRMIFELANRALEKHGR